MSQEKNHKDRGADPWELYKETVIWVRTVNQAVEKACVEVRLRLGCGRGGGEKKWQRQVSVDSGTLPGLRRLEAAFGRQVQWCGGVFTGV